MQLDLFGYESLTVTEKQQIKNKILNYYWTIRNLRKWKPNEKIFRATYRKIEVEKKRLLISGVSKDEVLNFLHCCRQTCKNGRGCEFCGAKYS